MKTITIDTNVINARQNLDAMNALEALAQQGKVAIYKTDVLDTEMKGGYINGYPNGLSKSKRYPEDVGVGAYGHFRWGHAEWGGDKDDQILEQVITLLFGKKQRSEYLEQEIRDAMNLLTHKKYGRDYFVTNDTGILKCRLDIEKELGVIVCTPEHCLTMIEEVSL